MNITTPIDAADARASALTDDVRLVEGGAPALLVDGGECVVVAANAAASRLLSLPDRMPIRLDRAMPAWATVRAHVAAAVPGRSAPAPLLWWTPAGPQTLAATLETIPRPARTFVRIVIAAAASTIEPPAAHDDAAQQAAANARATDLATLREIARRIRAGSTAPENAGSPAGPDHAAAPPVRRPPPLDFKPLATPGEATAPRPPAASTPPPEADLPPDTVAKLAHELRTPLSAIVLLSEIMRDERLGAMGNARYKTYAADIHDSARHTLDLISAMLDGAREVAGRDASPAPALSLADLDLNDIASRCVSAMQPIAARGSVTLEAAFDAALPPLLADRRAVRQIILNVLSNALRYTPRGGHIKLSTALRGDGSAVMTVADSGSGMRPADIDRALGNASATAVPRRIRLAGEQYGFGFGLPLVRELIEGHGGRLEIDSKPGEGTRVTVSFPADHVVSA